MESNTNDSGLAAERVPAAVAAGNASGSCSRKAMRGAVVDVSHRLASLDGPRWTSLDLGGEVLLGAAVVGLSEDVGLAPALQHD